MALETLTYAEIAERLNCSTEAVRALARRHRWPKLRGNDGRARLTVDLAEINHTPLPARSPVGHQPVTDRSELDQLQSKIETLNAEIVRLEAAGAGHRSDFERERGRAEQLMTELLKATADAMGAKEVAAGLAGELVATKETAARLDGELAVTMKTAARLQAELAALRSRSWWQRLVG